MMLQDKEKNTFHQKYFFEKWRHVHPASCQAKRNKIKTNWRYSLFKKFLVPSSILFSLIYENRLKDVAVIYIRMPGNLILRHPLYWNKVRNNCKELLPVVDVIVAVVVLIVGFSVRLICEISKTWPCKSESSERPIKNPAIVINIINAMATLRICT